ncbi:MAG TPA: DEAD/DEAH box helicase, partial [Myxococcaceae bacterium]|nr:DEAD/DEAH box helicase [Myxococcaceae bacterium]
AFERAKDTANAERVKALEVRQRVERGDRLGAATLLLAEGKKDEALETIKALPSTRAYRFLLQLKLADEARALAESEIAAADRDGKPGVKARWLEDTGDVEGAAQSWEKAERPDKALPLYERVEKWAQAAALAEGLGRQDQAVALYRRAGDTENAERVAALPPPATPQPDAAATPPPAPPTAEPETDASSP